MNNKTTTITLIAIMVMAAAISSCTSSRVLEAANGMKVETAKAVDLGLASGTLWATHNVGAESPEGYGNYYSWGETQPKKMYTWDSYSYVANSNGDNYEFSEFSLDGRMSLVGDSKADVATAQWGKKWHMPTRAQNFELLNDCKWTWTQLNGVNGYVVTGPNGKSIFMPAAGSYFSGHYDAQKPYAEGKTLYYWSGELVESESYKGQRAYCLIFEEDYPKFDDRNGDRCDGKPVRPVRK